MRYFLIIFIGLLVIKCDVDNKKLLLLNNTDDTIYYKLLTDTMLDSDMYLYKIYQDDSTRPLFVRGGEGAWEFKIKHESRNNMLYIFIFKTNKLNDSIIENNNFDRKGFQINKLDSLNWVVTYPNDF